MAGYHYQRERRQHPYSRESSQRDRKPSASLILRGLSYKSTDASLYNAFEQFCLLSAHVVLDRVRSLYSYVFSNRRQDTGKSRGFGFLSFESIKEATEALNTFGIFMKDLVFK